MSVDVVPEKLVAPTTCETVRATACALKSVTEAALVPEATPFTKVTEAGYVGAVFDGDGELDGPLKVRF